MTAHFLIVALRLVLERTPAAGAKHLIRLPAQAL
jgi:hypothetical protein